MFCSFHQLLLFSFLVELLLLSTLLHDRSPKSGEAQVQIGPTHVPTETSKFGSSLHEDMGPTNKKKEVRVKKRQNCVKD